MADSTKQVTRIASVLMVGGTWSLIKAVQQVTRYLQGDVVTCTVREAPTRAAGLRPFAIVMNDDVYAFDSAEFDALARDVRAELIIAPSGTCGAVRSHEALETRIARALQRGRR